MKSMKGSAQIRPANGRSSRSAHDIGREGGSEPRERVREWARVGGGEVLAFNAVYGDDQGRARRSARGGDRRTLVSEWLKQSRRKPFAAPSGLSVRQSVTARACGGAAAARVALACGAYFLPPRPRVPLSVAVRPTSFLPTTPPTRRGYYLIRVRVVCGLPASARLQQGVVHTCSDPVGLERHLE